MIKGRIISVGGPRAVARKFNPIVKEEMLNAASLWHRKMLPKHFRLSAKSEYGYETRSRLYMLRKSRKYGHQRPLEFTGNLKRMVTRGARITGTRTRVRVHMSTPTVSWKQKSKRTGKMITRSGSYVHFSKHVAGQPDIAGEMTTTTPAEAKKLIDRVSRRVERRINRIKDRETVTV